MSRIGELVGGLDLCYARSTYVALLQLSSERGNTAVIAGVFVSKIGTMAGLRYRSCFDALKILKQCGVIEITSNTIEGKKAKAANTYTLLPMRIRVSSNKHNPYASNGSRQTQRVASEETPLGVSSSEENEKESSAFSPAPAGGGPLAAPQGGGADSTSVKPAFVREGGDW